MHRVLVTVPPVTSNSQKFLSIFEKYNMVVDFEKAEQIVNRSILESLIPKYDGWILGDELFDEEIIKIGMSGNLRAAIQIGRAHV